MKAKLPSFKLSMLPKDKNDLTVIYKERENHLFEFKTSKEELLNALHFFGKKRNEINITKLIYVEEDIDFDIFKMFISSISSKELEINDENFESFYYLSKKYEYEELKEQIEQFLSNRPDVTKILDDISKQTDLVNFSIEPIIADLISKNIDISIKSGLLAKLPLKILNQILNSPKRKIDDHHLLFLFVMNILKESTLNDDCDENLLILPSSLDFCKMNSEEVTELFKILKTKPFLSPSHSTEKIEDLISKEKNQQEKFENLERQFSILMNEFNKEKEERFKNEKEMVDRIKKLENFQTDTEAKRQSTETKINKINVSINDIKTSSEKEINEIKLEISKIKENLNETNKKNEKEINEIKNSNGNIKSTNEKEINELKSSISNINEKIEIIINNSQLFLYKGDNKFEGIIDHLTKVTGGNIHNNNTITITCSKLCCGKLETLVDFKNSNGWTHVNGRPSPRWLQLDFKSKKIKINSYIIKTRDGNSDARSLKSWKVEISDDGSNWIMIDQRENVSDIKNNDQTHLFNVITKHNPFRFIRIITDQSNWYDSDGFCIGNLELFGKIFELH